MDCKWILSNMFNPMARGWINCRTKAEATVLLHKLEQRFKECKLELHPVKTRVVGRFSDDARTLSAGTAENLSQPLHAICKCYYEEPCAKKPLARF